MAFKTRDAGIAVRGLGEIQRALKSIDDGTYPELRARLKAIGVEIAHAAPGFVRHKTNRHSGIPRIEDSVRVSLNRNSASIYSIAPHGGVQNVGGRIGRNHATIIKRSDASHYMDKAVASKRGFVEAEFDAVLDWIEQEFGRG